MTRGYFGVGIYHGKHEVNFGTLWRSAYLYDAAFIFTVGQRYRRRQASDTPNTRRHVPLFQFDTVDDLHAHLPFGCPLVAVEMDPRAVPLGQFEHPHRAAYLLGAEDRGLPLSVLDRAHHIVQIETAKPQSHNVAVAGSLVLHDRHLSRARAEVLAR